MTEPARVEPSPARFVTGTWQRQDRHRLITTAGVLAIVASAAMAVLGLPPIDLHPPQHRFGVMDPLCGGTRAARLVMLGQWGRAWEYNPLGVLTVLAAAAAVLRALAGAALGRWLTITLTWTRTRRRLGWTIAVLLTLLLAIRQQLHVDLLTGPG